jgi:hypothetical protein
MLKEPCAAASLQGSATQKRKADNRESWVGGSQSIAKRAEGGQRERKVDRGGVLPLQS